MGSFDDPEIAEMVQFLDPEIVNMDQKISGSTNCRNCKNGQKKSGPRSCRNGAISGSRNCRKGRLVRMVVQLLQTPHTDQDGEKLWLYLGGQSLTLANLAA